MDVNVTHEELIAMIRKTPKAQLYNVRAWIHLEDLTKIVAMDLSE